MVKILHELSKTVSEKSQKVNRSAKVSAYKIIQTVDITMAWFQKPGRSVYQGNGLGYSTSQTIWMKKVFVCVCGWVAGVEGTQVGVGRGLYPEKGQVPPSPSNRNQKMNIQVLYLMVPVKFFI